MASMNYLVKDQDSFLVHLPSHFNSADSGTIRAEMPVDSFMRDSRRSAASHQCISRGLRVERDCSILALLVHAQCSRAKVQS